MRGIPKSRRRTVVFVTPGFSEPGGCASHGRKIAEGLARRGWSVHVITRLGSRSSLSIVQSKGLTVIEIPGFGHRRLGGALFLLLAIPLVMLRRRPHALMAMQLSSPATVASIGALIHRCPRLLIFSTSTGPQGEAAFVRASRTSKLRRWFLARASTLVAQTAEAAAELQGLVPGGCVEIVPTPVRLPQVAAELSGAAKAVYTGRIVQGKNLDQLIDVWPSVLDQVPGSSLTLVGSGLPGDPVEQNLWRRVTSSPELTESVTFTGWVSDVTQYVAGADVYVFPSGSEGMSNSLLEACALGRVIVASDIPANRAVLGDDYPLLVDLSDPHGLLRAIVSALTDDVIRTRAREQILERISSFRDTSVVERIEQLLERLP